MSDYEELVERAAKACRKRQFERTSAGRSYDPDVAPTEAELDNARAILAEVFRTLEKPTYEMLAVSENDQPEWNWLAMLRASPLALPKE